MCFYVNMSDMATKMKDQNKSSNKKKKKAPNTHDLDDFGGDDVTSDHVSDHVIDNMSDHASDHVMDHMTDHVNGDSGDRDPDPYEWEDDSNHNNLDADDRRRQVRNKTEKQRKDKIRSWISRISDIVPNCSDRFGGKKQVKSMNFILEKCYDYIVSLKDQNTALLTGKGEEAQASEISRLRKELVDVKEERDTLSKLLKENKPRVDSSKLWSERLDALKINPEKVDLTKLIKTMRKPHNLAHVIAPPTGDDVTAEAPPSEGVATPKKKRKVGSDDFEDEIENRPPLIDCNGGNKAEKSAAEDVPMFSPGSDVSNITPVDIPMADEEIMTSSGGTMTSAIDKPGHGLFGAQSALQTLASVATTDLSASSILAPKSTESLDQSRASLHPLVSSTTSVTQSVTMPIMSTSQKPTQSSAGQLGGTQLSGNIIMQNGQLIVLNDPLASSEVQKKKSPEKATKHADDVTSEMSDQSQLLAQQQNLLTANQQMNLGLPGQLPILNQSGMVPTNQGILPMNLGNLQHQQQTNLPQALILPDGRIIPVVTQPNLMFPSQMNNVIMAGNQSQTLIGSGANLFMNQSSMTSSSQGQALGTSTGSIQNLDQNLQPLLQQNILGQQVGLPLNYMLNQDGQVIQSVQQGLGGQFPQVPGQMLPTSLNSGKNQPSKDGGSQNMQQVQVITSSGTVLTLQVPAGQPGQQIILDPNTLQPIQQQTTASKMTSQQTTVTSQQQAQTMTTSTSLATSAMATSSATGKKNKKGQRVLMPKPTGPLMTSALAPQQGLVQIPHLVEQKEEKKTPKVKELTISQKMTALTNSALEDSTDILAKAAESIFSGDMSEFATEEKPESKDKKKRKKSGKKDKIIDPTSTMSGKDLAHLVIGSSEIPMTTGNNTLFSMANSTVIPQPEIKVPEVPKKKSKKKAKPNPKIDPNSLPDTITFDENDLSDVLDQVENINVPAEKSPEKKKKNKSGEPERKKRKQETKVEESSQEDVVDPGLQIVLDPPSSNSPASDATKTASPIKPNSVSPSKQESPQKPTPLVEAPMRTLTDEADPFGTADFGESNRPTKDATLKAIDTDETKESNNILDSISRIMDSPPPSTPGGEMEKESLLNENLSLLGSMPTSDSTNPDRHDENSSQKQQELFPDLGGGKSDDIRQKDNFSPFNFADSPSNQFDMDKRLKDLSPTSSASAPLLRHSVEALFSSGKKDKDSTSMPGSILSQLNSPSMDLTIQEEKEETVSKAFPAQQLLPELDTTSKSKEKVVEHPKERTGFFTSEGLAQPTSEPRKETMSAPSYFDPPPSMKSVIQKVDKHKDNNPPTNLYNLCPSSKSLSDDKVSEFARNSPPPLNSSSSSNNFFSQSQNTSFTTSVTSSVSTFSFSLTSTSSTPTTTSTAPSNSSYGSHHFPFYPIHPSLSGTGQGNEAMNLPFGPESGRGSNAPPPSLAMNNPNQSQSRYPNYGSMNQPNQFVEPQPMKMGPGGNPRFPQPKSRGPEMVQPRPYLPQELNQFDHQRMGPRMPNQFDIRNQRPPEPSQTTTMPSYSSPSLPGCEMGGVKNRTPDCNRPPSGAEVRTRRPSDQGSHLGNSPRVSDINPSPRMGEMNPSPRLGDLNQSPINQSPRIDQSPGRADNPKRGMDILPQQQPPPPQQRPRSGPGGQPMFSYPQTFNPPNPMASPPLHHQNQNPRELEMRSNFSENAFNPTQDFNPVLNFVASGFDPPPLELTSSGSTSTTQSQTFSRTSQSISQPSKPRDRNPPQPAPKRPPPAPKPKSRPKTNKKGSKPYEMDTNLSNSIFETGRSMTPYGVSFPISVPSPPPSRSDAPTYISMPFGPSRPLSNAGLMQHKPSPEMNSFGPLFPSNRPQNGLGLNFQPGFPGMNPMPHGNGPPHHPNNVSVTPHMPNFSLSNIFSDMSQNQDLNISPIKFPHGSLPPDHIQHPHQPGIYHQRGHAPMIPNAMSINSLLGHSHGFDARAMGPGMGPPFHGPGTPSLGMPPFNFNVHDH